LLGIARTRAIGAHEDVVSIRGRNNTLWFQDVSGFELEVWSAAGRSSRVANDGRNFMPAGECFVQNSLADPASRSEQGNCRHLDSPRGSGSALHLRGVRLSPRGSEHPAHE
jgi:hypothetical protein